MTDTLRAALYSILADDRETWVTMAMAIKSDRGEAGFTMWDTWSRQSDRYKAADARAVWRSVKPTGGITIATLYHMAKENGWAGQAPARHQPSAEERRLWAEARRREEAERNRREADAAAKAERMIMEAEYVDPRARRARNGRQSDEVPSAHPYLVAKGFAQQGGLVLDGNLLVPMRYFQAYERVQSVQMIGPDGSKKNLPGGKAKGAVYNLGRSWTRWYVEGYVTGLSVQAALRRMSRQDQVVVCFSAANLAHIATPPDPSSPRQRYVIADNDESGTGEKYARQTGLPYWMPPEPGTDANDYHQAHGVEALAKELRRMQSTM